MTLKAEKRGKSRRMVTAAARAANRREKRATSQRLARGDWDRADERARPVRWEER